MSERTPKRRRRISYQGKRLTPGADGHGPKWTSAKRARRGWLERVRRKPVSAMLLDIPGVPDLAKLAASIDNQEKSRAGMKPKRRG